MFQTPPNPFIESTHFPPEWLCVRCLELPDSLSSGDLRQRTEALAENCLRFSPTVVFSPAGGIFLEISRVQHLLSRASIKFRIHILAKRLGLRIQAIMGHEDPAWAWVMAQSETARQEKHEASLEAIAHYARAFGTEESVAPLRPFLSVLERLGIKTVGETLALSPGQLSARFPREVWEILDKIRGARTWQLTLYRPPEEFFETEEFPPDAPCIRMEGVHDRVQRMLRRISARLHARRLWIENLEVRLRFAAESTRESPYRAFTIHLFHPMGGALHLFEVIRNQLDFQTQTRRKLGAPVTGVEIFVRRTTRSRQQQSDFFCKKTEAQENAKVLENKVRALVGYGKSFYTEPVATHIPEESWRRSLTPAPRDGGESPIPQAERPSRIFPIPRQIEIDAQGRVHGIARMIYRVLSWQGPERILREWWRAPASGGNSAWRVRDYFKIRVAAVSAGVAPAQGEVQFWVFRDERKRFYIHGCFD